MLHRALGGLPDPVYLPILYDLGVPGEIKGSSLRNYPIVLAQIRGQEVAASMLTMLPDEVRAAILSGNVSASGWYPMAWKCAMLEAGRRATAEAGLARVMGAEMTRRDLTGVERLFMRMVSARHVLSWASRIFSSYVRPGSMRVVESRSDFVRVVFSRCEGLSHDVWQDVLGGCQASLSVAGAKDVCVRVLSGCRDGDQGGECVSWWASSMAHVSIGDSIPPPIP